MRREFDRAGRWMPRGAERFGDAVRELRFALRDPDHARNTQAVHRLRVLTGTQRDWELAVGKAMSLAMMDGMFDGTGRVSG